MPSSSSSPHVLSRRDLLWRGTQAVGAAVLASRFGMLSALAQTTNPFADYKALVCIFLNGGNDALNMIAPYDQTLYTPYYNARPTIALDRATMLQVNSGGQGVFGLHPNLTGIQTLYNQGKATVVCNVGTLLRPFADKNDYKNNPNARPKSLFDHGIQTDTWQALGTLDGWGNGIGAVLQQLAVQPSPIIPMLVNVTGGSSVYLAGTAPYITLPPGSQNGTLRLQGFGTSTAEQARLTALRNIYKVAHPDPVVKAINERTDKAIADGQAASDALAAANITTVFPTTGLGNQLLQIAKIIKARADLGANKRQIFFASIGGFDTHDAQLSNHPNLMKQLNDAVVAFYAATQELGLADKVTTFTLSEFGRTVQNSGDGTDHAWGSHALVVGGGVQGGRFYGAFPSLVLGGPDDVDTGTSARGRMLPKIAVDQYASTLAMWFGLDVTQVRTFLPNIDRFSGPNLGFMG
jgi:uncharacterized protein (DUF1501 family)